MKISLILSILFVGFRIVGYAETDSDWVKFEESSGAGISFEAPKDVVVDKTNERRTMIYAYSRGVDFRVQIETHESKRKLTKSYNLPNPIFRSLRSGQIGDFFVSTFEVKRPDSYAITISADSPTEIYYINVAASREDNPEISRFLNSIRLGGTPLSMASGTNASPLQRILIDELSMSPEVTEAMKCPDNTAKKINYSKIESEDSSDYDRYSRGLIIVKKPKAPYTDEARTKNVQGTISSEIEFLSTGEIGNITVDPALGHGLPESVVNAIRGIKFIPAQVQGKPVTVTRVYRYGFNIY